MGGERGLTQQVTDDELGLSQVKDPTALSAGGRDEVAGIKRAQIIRPQEAAVRLRFGPGVAAEPERGLIAEDGVSGEWRLEEEVANDAGCELLLRQVEDLGRLRAGSPDEVAQVGVRLGLEACAGDGVVLRLRARAGPVLGEGGRELAVQLRAGVVGQQLVGHVALRLGGSVVGRQIHGARHSVGDRLVRLGPCVKIQQSRHDLRIDLAAVVIARQRRTDAGAYGGIGCVIDELAGHEARDLRLIPVGQQGLVDEELHVRAVLVLVEVQAVDGGDGRVHLRGAAVGGQRIGDGRVHLDGRAVGGQGGQNSVVHAGLREKQGIGLPATVGVAGEGQGPVVVGQLDAQRRHGM